MGARRLRLAVVALLCGFALVCVGGADPGVAGATQFGTQGKGAGQFQKALGLGLDQETGDVYVPEFYDQRVSKFDGSGDFLFAWGWGVVNEAQEPQICTLTTGCNEGIAGPGIGEFGSGCGPQAAAVDNDPLSDSYKDVYVVDFCNHRVQKFGPNGNFLLMFGGHINETTGGNVCVLGEACTEGTPGTANGEFEWAYERSYIAVGPDGAVYVGDKARIQVFEPSGAWREDISLAGLSSEGRVTGLAVDATGDMFVTDEGVSGVRELEPGGAEKTTQFDAGSTSVEAIALDGSGDLFVADSTGGFHVLKFDPAGKELASFSNTAGETKGIVFSDALNELYVSSYGSVSILTPPPSGPLIEPGRESASAGLNGTATFEALVNPEGNETTYHFEYVALEQYQTSGYAGATSTTSASAGSSFEDQLATGSLAKLAPGVYHYRIVATNSQGTTTGPDQVLDTALAEGPWATNVASSSATLSASVDPLGTSTEYRLEYGTNTSYGHVYSVTLEGSSYVPVSDHLQELQPDTAYHYRLVLANEFGDFESADQTFTTQTAGSELTLPDGRAWELVSPPDKKGALIESFSSGGQIQAASDGSAITYLSQGPRVGEGGKGKFTFSQVLSTRGPDGWSSQDLSLPSSLPEEGVRASGAIKFFEREYAYFSPNLSLEVVEPQPETTPPLAPGVNERTLYLRDNVDGSFAPLVSSANVPSGVKFGGGEDPEAVLRVLAATPDLSHVVVKSPLALTQNAVSYGDASWNLYEWSAGQLQLINVLPDGQIANTKDGSSPSALLGGQEGAGGTEGGRPLGGVARTMSDDGRLIAWTWGSKGGLYVRNMSEGKTVRVGGGSPHLQGMSSDGLQTFFVEDGDLYAYNYGTGVETDLTVDHDTGEKNAGVQELPLGISEDGSYVYFMANGVLPSSTNADGESATPGHCINRIRTATQLPPASVTCNLYMSHYVNGKWEAPKYIATLSAQDEASWYTPAFGGGAADLSRVSARVSPDGRYLTFMSERSLTGYDNLDAYEDQPDEEVYLYDAMADKLSCASCDPTGARPVGVLDTGPLVTTAGNLLVDRNSAWGLRDGTGEHLLAGSLPGWDEKESEVGTYQPRYLSDDGRLFFDSPDALVPQDTNGLEDVYEYEPPASSETAASDDCTTASPTFSALSGGCVNLISSGISKDESAFFDASENGDDAFFITSSKLTGADYDTSYDVYDAHVCSTVAPCTAESVSPPPCTSGDSCKAAPAPQPAIFGPAPSATFNGIGNVTASQPKPAVKAKSLTRAQKLAGALRSCRKKRAKKKRSVCERKARKQYATSHPRKATAKRGNRR